MHVGFFINTPAHAHLYRETIRQLEDREIDVTVFARDDSCTLDILDYYDIAYLVYGARNGGRLELAQELPGHLWRIKRAVADRSLDVIFGMGVYSTYAAWLANATAITVMDSEPLAFKQRLTSPIVGAFLTPASFRRDLGPKHFVFDGFKETAYLHPAIFTPTGDARQALELSHEESFSIVRFNAFNGHHDMGRAGFSTEQKQELIRELDQFGTVFVSDEAEKLDISALPAKPYDAHPALMHDALAEADLLIADTQTMVTEAALLGTPAIRSNSFVGDGDMGNFQTLESAGLVWNYPTFEGVLEAATTILSDPDMDETLRERHATFMADKCNLTAVFVDLVESLAAGQSIESALSHHGSLRPNVVDHDTRSQATESHP